MNAVSTEEVEKKCKHYVFEDFFFGLVVIYWREVSRKW